MKEIGYDAAASMAGHDADLSDLSEVFPEWLSSLIWWPISITWFCVRLIARFSKLAFLLSISAMTYQWIYGMVVPPSLSESHPINFLYPEDAASRRGGLVANTTVDFAFQRQLMLRAGTRGMDWSSDMATGSSLDVGVSLSLPESPVNFDLGSFMVNATVFDKQGLPVGQGKRSFVLQHKSSLLQWISTTFYSIPMVLGFTSERQTLKGTVVQLVTSPKGGLHSAMVTLSDSRLQVLRASIEINFVLVGFRYYLFHWYLTCLSIGTLIISNLYLKLIQWVSKRLFGDSQAWGVQDEIDQVVRPPRRQTSGRGRKAPRVSKARGQGERLGRGGEEIFMSPGGPYAARNDDYEDEEDEDDPEDTVDDEGVEDDDGEWIDEDSVSPNEADENAEVGDDQLLAGTELMDGDDAMAEVSGVQLLDEDYDGRKVKGEGEDKKAGSSPAAMRDEEREGIRRRNNAVPGPASPETPR